MNIFAISDLHLSFSTDKPMDVFGARWENYWQTICTDWTSRVTNDDLVLISGDISWAMTAQQAKIDLAELSLLPGKKVIIRGNHDYWWSSYAKVCAILPQNIFAIQNNCLRFDDCLVCGTRGWGVPTEKSTDSDKKIFERELIRLTLTLTEMQKLRKDDDFVVVMLHYPPFDISLSNSAFTDLIAKYNVDCIVYGHLHGKDCRAERIVDKQGTPYFLTSCDQVGHNLVAIRQF